MIWSNLRPGLPGITLLSVVLGLAVGATLAAAPGPADAKGRSGKEDSSASGKSGKNHSGHRHSGRHSHRSRHGGFYWAPDFWPWWDYVSYPVVAMEPVPVQYVERNEQEAQPADHWLYCAKAQGYFPYVGDCPDGWERVPAAPLK